MRYNNAMVEKVCNLSNHPPSRIIGGNNMAVSKAQQKAVNKYVRENYDRVNVNMAKGKKEVVQAHAEAQGESLNAFINRAITETMERDSEK